MSATDLFVQGLRFLLPCRGGLSFLFFFLGGGGGEGGMTLRHWEIGSSPVETMLRLYLQG
jgi:hypothetical protein